jgi:uncharacterized protein
MRAGASAAWQTRLTWPSRYCFHSQPGRPLSTSEEGHRTPCRSSPRVGPTGRLAARSPPGRNVGRGEGKGGCCHPRCALSYVPHVESLARQRHVAGLRAVPCRCIEMPHERLPWTDRTYLELDLLPGPFAVIRLDPGACIPAWVQSETLFSVTRTRTEPLCSATTSTSRSGPRLSADSAAFASAVPLSSHKWASFGPSLEPLAAAGISVFATSTCDTDYVLVSGGSLEVALRALSQSGHIVHRLGAAERLADGLETHRDLRATRRAGA